MKRKLKYLCAIIALALSVLVLTGCADVQTEQIDTKTAVLQNMADVTSVESSITLEMKAHIGAYGETSAHSASIGSDATIQMTTNPLAVYAEYYSRILVDGVTTRDDKEYYIVQEDGVMNKYLCVDSVNDEWEQITLTKAEAMGVSTQTGLIYDWASFLSYLKDDFYTESVEGKTCYRLSGDVPSSLLQEFFGTDVFGTFMHSTEMLLADRIPCILYVDSTTYRPVQILLTFENKFIVTDMMFSAANVTVTYSKWNEISSIEVPKKVAIVASNPDVEFYNTYYAWNLFLPYITNGDDPGNNPSTDPGLSFTADWSTFQIRIDGGMTKLPILYSDLEKLGYSIDATYGSTIIEANQYIDNITVRKGADILYCTLYNPDTVPQPINRCTIGTIDFSASNNPNNGIKIFLPGEVCLGITKDALLSAYGEPDELHSAFSSDTYIWHGENENQAFVAEVSPISNLVIRICLKNIPVTGGRQ